MAPKRTRQRPKVVAELRAELLAHAPAAVAVLAELLHSADERVALAAAVGLLDRAGLRPYSPEPERVEVTGEPSAAVERLRELVLRRLGELRPADAPGPREVV